MIDNLSCAKCSKILPHTNQFFLLRTGIKKGIRRSYLSKTCRECLNSERRQYDKKNKVKKLSVQTKHRKERIALGLCKRCSKKALSNAQMCESHWFISIAVNAGFKDRIESGRIVKEIMVKQNYRCPYTGEVLVPGINCSLDHILPRSRFKELITNIDNLEWVTKLVNRSKYDMTKEEYYKFIENILQNKCQLIEGSPTPLTI